MVFTFKDWLALTSTVWQAGEAKDWLAQMLTVHHTGEASKMPRECPVTPSSIPEDLLTQFLRVTKEVTSWSPLPLKVHP